MNDKRQELADAAPELLALIQEMYDYGEPTPHYRDHARGKRAWEKAEQMFERFRDDSCDVCADTKCTASLLTCCGCGCACCDSCCRDAGKDKWICNECDEAAEEAWLMADYESESREVDDE